MLALLPMRGWAAASMTMPAAAAGASVHVVADDSARAVPSCHDALGDQAAQGGHACNLCDLCHGAAADVADTTVESSPLPDVTPRPAAARDSGRQAVGGLDRPPKNMLA